MSLPSLQWRKLPVRNSPPYITSFTASAILNTIYDMLTGSVYFDGSTRVAGSGSAWSASLKFTTGSNTEAIVCRPPLYTTISQSIIFAGISGPAPSSSAVPPMCGQEAYTSSFIHIACVKNASGSFTQWTSQYPFGSGSYSTGYAKMTGTVHMGGLRLTIYESKEAIAVFFCYPSHGGTPFGVHASVGGAMVDPEQNTTLVDAEEDGRLYAIATSGVQTSQGTLPTNPQFLTLATGTTGNIFTHDPLTTPGYSRFIGFYPQQQATMSINAYKPTLGTTTSGNTYGGFYATFSNRLIQNPLYCLSAVDSVYIGRLRDINITRGMQSNIVVRDASNNIVGFTFGYSENAVSQSVLFPYN